MSVSTEGMCGNRNISAEDANPDMICNKGEVHTVFFAALKLL